MISALRQQCGPSPLRNGACRFSVSGPGRQGLARQPLASSCAEVRPKIPAARKYRGPCLQRWISLNEPILSLIGIDAPSDPEQFGLATATGRPRRPGIAAWRSSPLA